VEHVRALVTPILFDLGLHLYDVDYGAGLLKITVDRAGGVDLDTLSLVSRLVSRELDHADPVPGTYTLEVSSPGIERALRRPEHFSGVLGRTVTVRLRDVTNDARRFQGTLTAADDTGISVLLDDGTTRTVPYAHIDRARTVFEWGVPAKGPAKRPTKGSAKGPATRSGAGTATTAVSTNQPEARTQEVSTS